MSAASTNGAGVPPSARAAPSSSSAGRRCHRDARRGSSVRGASEGPWRSRRRRARARKRLVARAVENDRRGIRELVDDRVGCTQASGAPACFVAPVDENRAAARAIAGLDIVEDVPDHPRALEVHAMGGGRIEQQSRTRLAAGARDGGTHAGWRMRTPAIGGEHDAKGCEQFVEACLDRAQRCQREAPERHARLVRDDEKQEACILQRTQRVAGTGDEIHARGIDVVRHVVHERAVLVDEDGRRIAHVGPGSHFPRLRPLQCAVHGHDDSSTGRTVISATTDSRGWESAKRTARATSRGSCSFAGSRSGNRSSRNGVRIPPAITAVTRTLCARNSACIAYDNPSNPHLLAWYALAFGQPRFAAVDATLTMSPRLSRSSGSANFDSRNGPRRLVRMIASQSSTSISSTPIVRSIPALLTTTSRRPKRFLASSMKPRTSSGSPTSPRNAYARRPSRVSAAATLSARSLRSATNTWAPACASSLQIAAPSPWPPPVTTTTFCVRSVSKRSF